MMARRSQGTKRDAEQWDCRSLVQFSGTQHSHRHFHLYHGRRIHGAALCAGDDAGAAQQRLAYFDRITRLSKVQLVCQHNI
jgi:hypothetical protein